MIFKVRASRPLDKEYYPFEALGGSFGPCLATREAARDGERAGSRLSQSIKASPQSRNMAATEAEPARDPITRDTIIAGRLRDVRHANYGKLGVVTSWQHTTVPRLSAVDRPLNRAEAKKVGASPSGSGRSMVPPV